MGGMGDMRYESDIRTRNIVATLSTENGHPFVEPFVLTSTLVLRVARGEETTWKHLPICSIFGRRPGYPSSSPPRTAGTRHDENWPLSLTRCVVTMFSSP